MLDQSIQYIKGIGPKRAQILSRLGITTVRDALSYLPREYEDRRIPARIALALSGSRVVIEAKVEVV